MLVGDGFSNRTEAIDQQSIDQRLSDSVRFRPWIGQNYTASQSRILVIGESHYSNNPDDNDDPEFTRWVVHQHLDAGPQRTLASFEKAMPESGPTFWNSSAFYNYVQSIVTKAGIRPTNTMFSQAQQPFFEVVDLLKPRHIVVWGRSLWNELPPFAQEGPVLRFDCDGNDYEYGYYDRGWGRTIIMPVKHPSRGFSPRKWKDVINAFVAMH